MNVLMIGPIAASGGVAMHTSRLIEALEKKGVGVELYDINCSRHSNIIINRIGKLWKRLLGQFFFAIHNYKKYDIIHVQASGGMGSFISAISGVIVGAIMSKPVFVTFHYSNTGWFVKKHPICVKFVLKWCKKFIVVSKNQCDLIVNSHPDLANKVICIPNGYDNAVYYGIDKRCTRHCLKNPGDKIIIYNISNLMEGKGQRYLIEAISKLSHLENIICHIAGCGPEYDNLNALICHLNLQEHVKLLGWISNEENAANLNACDLFVFPSLRESFGIVLIEAMACGKPCVATINGGSEGILTSENLGYLVPPADSNALAKAIDMALEKKWDGKYISEFVMNYNWDDIAMKTLDLYFVCQNGVNNRYNRF